MRHASQCLGRVIRGKDDYGIMVLADKRFARKRNQLPKWINQTILESEVNLSTDMAVATAKNFLRTMAQPFKAKDHEGVSSWTPAQLEEHIAKRKMEQDRIERGLEPVAPERNGGDNNNHNMNGAQVDKDEFDDDIDEELMMLDT
jgi:DNA excision repair protein ERCC-2